MANLIWKGKTDISAKFEALKNKFSTFFNPILNDNTEKGQNVASPKVWVNKLFWGDNFKVLYYLLSNFKDKIDLIYIDPPFFSGINYKIRIYEQDKESDSIAYFDTWQNDLDSYLQMLYERILLFKQVLSGSGLLFIHLDWHASHYIKLILDEVFGENRFINNIVWYYYNKYSAGKRNLPRAHDNILVYSKSNHYTFNELREPRKKPRKQLMRINVDGVLKNLKDEKGHVKYRTVYDKKIDDVWKIPCLQPASKEWTGFPTQKHHLLLERILKLGSNQGDLVGDFFCGSGTTLLAAEKLKRRWVGSDISKYSIYLTRKRLMNHLENTSSPKSFRILTNLNSEHKQLIESGFFQKDLKIKRKKN
jgi:adenine specific DNA methylase Mod